MWLQPGCLFKDLHVAIDILIKCALNLKGSCVKKILLKYALRNFTAAFCLLKD